MDRNDDNSWPPLIQALLNPEVYEHQVDEICCLETHISWVILTGPYAYKIKKPVSLGFVEFSTLENRRFYCQEELRLNRRFAAKLYLEVVPITGSVDAPKMNGIGEPIEYAVKMEQFPTEELLSHLIQQEGLLPQQIDQLARDVALFHNQVEIATEESPFGTPECIYEVARENFRHLFLTSELSAEWESRINQLNDYNEQRCRELKPVFEQRKQTGFVRECHGDMHLGNMIQLDGKLTLFDCIEFNENFRWIDILSEIAFCVMDLEFRGRSDLAYRFLNGYLEQTGDYQGMVVLPFYLVYRALVRAKVAAIRVQQSQKNDLEQQGIIEECQGYLDLAEHYTKLPEPFLMITHGFSGSGKTWGSQSLVEQASAIRVRSDVERKRLFGLQPLDRSETRMANELYAAEATSRTYQRLADAATAVIRAGYPVIVDATFLKRDTRDTFCELANRLKVPFIILDFQTSEDVLKDRIVNRNQKRNDASEADLNVLDNQINTADPLGNDELKHVITLKEGRTGTGESLVEAVGKYRQKK